MTDSPRDEFPRAPGRPLYLTAGNFPSQAANCIQVAQMAAAYAEFLPALEVAALSGYAALRRRDGFDLERFFGLPRKLPVRYLPFLPRQKELLFDREHRPPRWFYWLVGYYAFIRRSDLVFTRKAETALVTLRCGLRTVWESHVPWEECASMHGSPELLASPFLRALVTITGPIAESFENAGLPPGKLLIEPDGVDPERFCRPSRPKERCRDDLGLATGEPICVYCGHLHENRGVETILESARALPAVKFLFVGGWPADVEDMRAKAVGLGLQNVSFAGHVEGANVPDYLSAADVLLMPYGASLRTRDRCSPLKMFEYLASGRPIVASDLPILREVLVHRRNAMMIPPDSPADLTSAIERILASPGLARGLGEAARATSLRYSWRARARRVLRKALAGDRCRDS